MCSGLAVSGVGGELGGRWVSYMQWKSICLAVEEATNACNNWIACNSKPFTCLLGYEFFVVVLKKTTILLSEWNKPITKILLKVSPKP